MPSFFRLLATLCLLLASHALAAVVDIADDHPSRPASHALSYLRDDTHRLRLDDIRALPAAAWRHNEAEIFNQGYSAATWWLRVDVRNSTTRNGRQLLEIAYPVLDDLEVWVFDGPRLDSHHPLGERLPFAARPVFHRNFLVPLDLAPGVTETVYMRVRSTSSIQVPVTLWQADAHGAHDQLRLIGHGIYFGTMFVMAIYNLFVFFVLRDRSYLYYVLSVACMAGFLGCLNGLAFQYLWPEGTTWTNQVITLLLAGTVLFAALFANRLLQLRQFLPRFRQGLVGVVVLTTLIIAITLLRPDLTPIATCIAVAFVGCLGCLVAGALRWHQGDSTARLYCIAWSSMLSGGILLALNKYGLLPQTPFTENAVQFGSAIEVILLSFALADRINVERQLRFDAQREALSAQLRANETLENRVQERTVALESANGQLEVANRQLALLSTTDPLTGLRNRRHLDTVLSDETARCHRHQRPLSVLLMDIDHFKRFNDSYGHQVGDECLRQVAIVLQECVRWSADRIARYGGEEFCVVLPETDAEGARTVAERVRSAVEAMTFLVNGERVPVTLSIGVASGVPESDTSDQAFMTQADVALYAAKAAGRNRVIVTTTTSTPSA